MQPDDFRDLISNCVNRRKGAHRFLEDHGDIATADISDGLGLWVKLGEIDHSVRIAVCIEVDLTLYDAAGGIDDLQDRARGYAFARAAFANQTECFSTVEL